MKRAKGDNRKATTADVMFLGSFLSIIVFSIGAFLDFLFIIPMLISFFVWLGLTLTVLRRMGVSLRTALLKRKLVSGLPCNKKLHAFYIVTLLVSLMLYFTLMLVGKGLYLLLAFTAWLYIGSLFSQELGGEDNSRKVKKTIKN
ncbi:MAG: hypothetical protein WED04_05420 [Promethearchaeati archaeon SRVP18_Atabeyarchaeia-1]